MRAVDAVKETIADASSVSPSSERYARNVSYRLFHGVYFPHQRSVDTQGVCLPPRRRSYLVLLKTHDWPRCIARVCCCFHQHRIEAISVGDRQVKRKYELHCSLIGFSRCTSAWCACWFSHCTAMCSRTSGHGSTTRSRSSSSGCVSSPRCLCSRKTTRLTYWWPFSWSLSPATRFCCFSRRPTGSSGSGLGAWDGWPTAPGLRGTARSTATGWRGAWSRICVNAERSWMWFSAARQKLGRKMVRQSCRINVLPGRLLLAFVSFHSIKRKQTHLVKKAWRSTEGGT